MSDALGVRLPAYGQTVTDHSSTSPQSPRYPGMTASGSEVLIAGGVRRAVAVAAAPEGATVLQLGRERDKLDAGASGGSRGLRSPWYPEPGPIWEPSIGYAGDQ